MILYQCLPQKYRCMLKSVSLRGDKNNLLQQNCRWYNKNPISPVYSIYHALFLEAFLLFLSNSSDFELQNDLLIFP